MKTHTRVNIHLYRIGICSAIIIALVVVWTAQKLGAGGNYPVVVIHPVIWDARTVGIRNAIVKLGMQKELADKIVNECKKFAPISARHCVVLAVSISSAESNLGRNAYQENVFGSKAHAGTQYDAVERFVKVYVRYYFKPSYDPSDFYVPHGIPRTHYCTDEESSNSSVGCPNGARISWNTWNKLITLP